MSESGLSRRAARKQAINNQRSRNLTEDIEGGEGEGLAMTETKPGDDDAKASVSSNMDDKGGAAGDETTASGYDNNSLAESKNDSGGRSGRRQRRNEGSSSGGADDDIEAGGAKPEANTTYGPLRVLEPIRQDPIKNMQVYKKNKMERLSANSLPEDHFVGQRRHLPVESGCRKGLGIIGRRGSRPDTSVVREAQGHGNNPLESSTRSPLCAGGFARVGSPTYFFPGVPSRHVRPKALAGIRI